MADIDAIIRRHAERAIEKALAERGLGAPRRTKRVPKPETVARAPAEKPVRSKRGGKKKARRAIRRQEPSTPERPRGKRKKARAEATRSAKRKRSKSKQRPEQLTLF